MSSFLTKFTSVVPKLKACLRKYIKDKILHAKSIFERDVLSWAKRAFFRSEFNEQTTVALSHHMMRRLYDGKEKIRIAFIFQGASFWPSWDSLWEAVNADGRFEASMYVCDDVYKEKSQFQTARKFLNDAGIPFTPIHDANLTELNPHIVVLQTPYDGGHRPKYLHGNALTAKGFRVVYIPYGIEISDTQRGRNDHFSGSVTRYAWRIYTFSEKIISDYKRFSLTGGDMVRSFGHPKFDHFVGAHRPSMPQEILDAAKGRKIVLWKVHFPKKLNGRLITPSMQEYFNFAKSLLEYPDLYFVFMPHPKFYETADEYFDAKAFAKLLDTAENAMQFFGDDYRGVLLNSDFYMIDRSALMIEAGVTGKPILFLSNKSYREPMTKPIQGIVDSYYQAVDCAGMKKFISEVVVGGLDSKQAERSRAIQETIPPITGQSGLLIKNDMVNGLLNENPAISKIVRARHAKKHAAGGVSRK